MDLAYLTADLPGTGGVLKEKPDDFRVDEIPLYEPCGEGEHLYLHIRKRGLATFEAIRRIAAELGVPENDVAYAGLKDARAVTTQWISIHGVEPDRARAIDLDRIEILRAERHGNKLRIGHLRGNRFSILVRDAGPGAAERAAAVLDVLVRRGAPNYFGHQRFGTRGNGHLCGEAILRRDYDAFVRHLLGGPPGPERDPWLVRARRLFDQGKLDEAYEAMPVRRRAEKKCLHALIRFCDPERAYFAVPRRMRQLFASAYQSWLFNRILDRRIEEIDTMQEGDVAMLHRNGAVFRVTDLEAERVRCRAFEISPTGPIFGPKSIPAGGAPGELERAVLAKTGLEPADFDVGGGIRLNGLRRALRIPVREAVLQPAGQRSFRIEFSLPRGCFATSVLREILKNGDA